MGFEEATPIQEGTIRLGMEGKDIIGQAQTGTGKTTAFGIPLIEKIDTKDGNVQGLIIAPTRELTIQVSEELNRLGQDKNVRILSVYDGQEISRQIRELNNSQKTNLDTTRRLLYHINPRTHKLH